MTQPVILFGTQSNGETLPVQVDATGRLVAEGLQGIQGPPGPPGPAGDEGPPGSDGITLPPDPFEGALLGWSNGELAWINTAPPLPVVTIKTEPFTGAWDSAQIRDVDGNAFDPVEGWDAAARALPTWSMTTAAETVQGVSVKGAHRMTTSFDLYEALGLVLTINVAIRWTLSAAGYSQESFVCDSEHISALFQTNGIWGSNSSVNTRFYAYQFLVNRPEILGAKFTFNLTGTYLNTKPTDFTQFQSWSLDSPGEAALKRQIYTEQSFRSMSEQLRADFDKRFGDRPGE